MNGIGGHLGFLKLKLEFKTKSAKHGKGSGKGIPKSMRKRIKAAK
jgi:hypothetical protein